MTKNRKLVNNAVLAFGVVGGLIGFGYSVFEIFAEVEDSDPEFNEKNKR